MASYNSAVLEAYRQTADAVTGTRLADARLASARQAVAANEESHRIIAARYQAGLVTYLDVLQVDDRLLAARLALTGGESAARSSDLALVRALGGGLPANQPTTSAAAPIAQTKDAPHG